MRKLNQELNLIGNGGNGDEDLTGMMEDGLGGDTIEAKRRKLFMQLKNKVCVWGGLCVFQGGGRRGGACVQAAALGPSGCGGQGQGGVKNGTG